MEYPLGISRQLLVFRIGVLGKTYLDELDLFELVLADQPARVPTVTSRFTAKARTIRRVALWQILRVEYLLRMIGRDRHFRRRDEGKSALIADVEQIVFELRKLVCTEERRTIDKKRRQRLGVAVLGGVNIEHEIYKRTFEPGTRTIEDRKA